MEDEDDAPSLSEDWNASLRASASIAEGLVASTTVLYGEGCGIMSNPDTWNPVRPPFFTLPCAAAPLGVHIARVQLPPSPWPWAWPWGSCRTTPPIPGKAPFPAAATAVLPMPPPPSPCRE